MVNIWLKLKNWLLLIGDVAILYLSLWLTLLIRYGKNYYQMIDAHLWPFSILFAIWIIIFYISNLYDLRQAKNKSSFFFHLLLILTICGAIGAAFFYFAPIAISPKTNLILDLAITAILIFIWRVVFNSIVSTPRQNIVIIGNNEETHNLSQEIKQHPQWGYRLVKVISPQNLNELDQAITNDKVSIIVISDDLYQTQKLIDKLYESLIEKIEVYTLADFYEMLLQKIPPSIISKAWFLRNLAEGRKQAFDRLKRIFDIILSSFGIIISLPLYPFLIAAIKLDSNGPIFYTQTRLGKLGRPFRIIKFRTMVKDAEKNGAEWAKPNDSRITKTGKLLRRTRLDELPQLFNVFWGEMSIVGPRPERPEFIQQLEQTIPFYRQRLLTKPGITGWAQVNYKYSSNIAGAMEKLQYDLYYIKNRSFYLDLIIILKTIKIILTAKGQ